MWRVCRLWSGCVMGGLLLQDMRSFGRATGPDLSLGLQSPPPAFLELQSPPPPPAHAQHVSLGLCCPMGVALLRPSTGDPLAPLSHSPGVAAWSTAGRMDR